MSDNSTNKAPITNTKVNTAGKARVDFDKSDFDAAIEQKGYEVYLDKVVWCPCRRKGDTMALPSCQNCGGSGYVYINRFKTKMILQSMNMETKFKEWSQEKIGSVKVTSKNEDNLSFMDRITLVGAEITSAQVLYPILYENKMKAKSIYDVKGIEDIFTFEKDTKKLKRLQINVDYTYSGNIFTFDDQYLTWENLTISIRYKHEPSFHIIDMVRETMTTSIKQTFGADKKVVMPVSAIARKSHYVLDEENYNGSYLFDNSYELSGCGNDQASEFASSGIYQNSDLSYIKQIASNTEFTAPDIIVTDSDETQYPWPANKPVICSPPTPSTYENSDGSYSESIVSGGTLIGPDVTLTQPNGDVDTFPANKNLTCAPCPAPPNTTYQNSDGSYIEIIRAGETFTSPNINFTDSDNVTTQIPSNIDVVATPCGLGSGYHYKSFMPTWLYSYQTGDEGWRNTAGEFNNNAPSNPLVIVELDHTLEGFYWLKENNEFGNKARFTDDSGNYYLFPNVTGTGGGTFTGAPFNPNNYVIDHLYGVGWLSDFTLTGSQSGSLVLCNSATNLGFTNWKMPINDELISIMLNRSQFSPASTRFGLAYFPFNEPTTGHVFWSGTTSATNQSYVVSIYSLVGLLNIGWITNRTLKTYQTGIRFMIRKHYNI